MSEELYATEATLKKVIGEYYTPVALTLRNISLLQNEYDGTQKDVTKRIPYHILV